MDCQSVIDVVDHPKITPEKVDRKYKYLQTAAYDLITAAKGTLHFVRSHQDTKKSKLTFEESINWYCDQQAKPFVQERNSPFTPEPNNTILPLSSPYLLSGIPIYEDFETALLDHKYEPRILKKLNSLGYPTSSLEIIDWNNLQYSIKMREI